MTATYEYGTKVIEFIQHSDEELQELIAKKEAQYYSRSEGLQYTGLAAYIDFNQHKPLEQSLIEMQGLIQQGYTIFKANYRNLFFECMLRKTDAMIAAELPKLTELAKEEYAELRYAANVAETARQMEITIEKRARDAAAAKAAAEAKHKADEEAFALADLLRAYGPKAKAKVKQEVAA